MSLILEALRKSEAERRRGLAPDVAMELPPAPASRPRALATWLLPALVVVALLVLAGWWTRREAANPALTVTTTETRGDITPPAADATPQRTPPAPRIQPRPAIAASVQVPATTAAAPTPPPTTAPPAASAGTATSSTSFEPAPIPVRPASIPPATRNPPPPESEISNDTAQLPPIKLSMLMWDDVPSKRFVILNGQRMAEGDRHDAITVISIERSGVVVENNGAKARVPLP